MYVMAPLPTLGCPQWRHYVHCGGLPAAPNWDGWGWAREMCPLRYIRRRVRVGFCGKRFLLAGSFAVVGGDERLALGGHDEEAPQVGKPAVRLTAGYGRAGGVADRAGGDPGRGGDPDVSGGGLGRQL